MAAPDSAAHKPEAQAKGHGILRLRLRLVCCIILHHDLACGTPKHDRSGASAPETNAPIASPACRAERLREKWGTGSGHAMQNQEISLLGRCLSHFVSALLPAVGSRPPGFAPSGSQRCSLIPKLSPPAASDWQVAPRRLGACRRLPAGRLGWIWATTCRCRWREATRRPGTPARKICATPWRARPAADRWLRENLTFASAGSIATT
jgi:hypothetical protein